MKPLGEAQEEYRKLLKERSRTSRAYHAHQLIGYEIAVLLRDLAHKSLYIKLAKTADPERLLAVAKSIAENPRITNRGAYFMKIVTTKP